MNRLTSRLFLSLALLVLLAAAPVQAVAAPLIVIDAGHGGTDFGAVSANGLQEKHVNLDIAWKVKLLLDSRGYETTMTRETDTYISLAERVRLTGEVDAALFVSIHANAHTDTSARGSLVLYYDRDYPQSSYPASTSMTALTPESKRLAQTVLDYMIKRTGFANLGIVPSAAYVTRMGKTPSVLVETAFLSNSRDAALLADDSTRAKLASGIADGITAFLPVSATPRFTDTLGHWAAPAIARLQEQGLVEGDGLRFYPDASMTRAEWLTLADRLFGIVKQADARYPTVGQSVYAEASPYSDLNSSHWAYPTFLAAIRLGYISGYEDQTMRPDRAVTRAEAAAMLERLTTGAQTSAWTGDTTFQDVPRTYWAAGPIYRLQQKGVFNGVAAASFAPAQPMKRAEMAAMIDRYMSKQTTPP